MLQLCAPVNNKVLTTFTPILIPDKNIRELGNNVNPTSKKLQFSCFGLFMVGQKITFEKLEKNNPS